VLGHSHGSRDITMATFMGLPELIIIHLLGLAPAGYLAAPDNGAERRYAGWCMPNTQNGRRLSRCAIEPAESGVVRKPPRRKKITTQV
jgi:hypothetical protein